MRRSILIVMGAMMALMGAAHDVSQARALAGRLSSRLADKVAFHLVEGDSADVFTLESRGDTVFIGGNNALSMAVGLNRYLNRYCHVTVSWYADVPVELPATLPAVPRRETVRARVPQRFFLNYCTYGYTMPFWDWRDWERFIDWMALNGVNMPLAITGQEAVWLNVWRQMGMTEQEVREFFTGPAYLPWHRMANIDAWCGPLPQEWLDKQARLQQLILERERALNMRPVLPAFAGHVPRRLKELYPDADIKAMSAWDDFAEPYRTYFLHSEDPLYATIQRLFLEEQTRMYGTDHIYGIDPFNEMDPPSFEPQYLHDVSRHIYESLAAVDPQAEWLQMGWFLYYQRRDYTDERARAMLTGVPQGRMTMLDYYCEYKEMWRDLDGFYGQPFIWCYLGNFGGNSNIQGNVKAAGERLERALAQAGDNLVGIGSTLEGLDVQQFPYEYILEKAWDFKKNERQVVDELADRHAGRYSPAARRAWRALFDSVLCIRPTTFNGPLPCSRPMLGKENRHCAVRYDAATLLTVWDTLLEQDSVTTDAMTIDLIWTGRQLLGDAFGVCKHRLDSLYQAGSRDKAHMRALITEMRVLLDDMDRLNAEHPYCTAAKWIEQARDLGDTPAMKDYYEMNARRLITTWGGDLNDYACRNWSGLLASYYVPRWEAYLKQMERALDSGKPFDQDAMHREIDTIQQAWPIGHDSVAARRGGDVLGLCRELRRRHDAALRLLVDPSSR